MNQKLLRAFLLAVSVFLLANGVAEAHQPNFLPAGVADIKVSKPEISKAYYGILPGLPGVRPMAYTIKSAVPFKLYVGLLSPDLPGAKTDFSVSLVNVVYPGQAYTTDVLDGSKFKWTKWHEEYADDSYNKGPELRKDLPAGEYWLIVTNPGMFGKYVLAVGETESFPFYKSLNMLAQLVSIKTMFFGKPWYSAFSNRIGLFAAIELVILIFIGVGFYFLYKFIKKRREFKKRRSGNLI